MGRKVTEVIYCQYRNTKMVEDHGREVRATVTAEIHSIGSQSPYFSITVDGPDFGGCMHDMVRKEWPHLAPYIRWHLVSVNTGPMHYIANARYWAGHSGWCDGKPNSPPNAEHLKSTIVYGAVDGDESIEPMDLSSEALAGWLKERFEPLMAAFDQDMGKLFGDQYVLSK